MLNASSESKDVAEDLPVMAWLQIHGWRAKYCNFFAQDLSYYVLGHLPWESLKRANDIHDYIMSSQEFFQITKSEISNYVDKGFMVYLTINEAPRAGHIAVGWINNTENKEIIQAGAETGKLTIDEVFGSEVDVSINIYLGFLKKEI